jgi:hypothetical protein
VRYNVAFTLLPDDRVSATLEGIIADASIEALGMDPVEFWTGYDVELIAELPPGSQAEHYASGGYSGIRAQIPATPIAQMFGLEIIGLDGTTFWRDGNYFLFSTMAGMAEEVADFGSEFPDEIASAQMTLTLTCPGAVIEADANGRIGGSDSASTPASNVVVWDLTQISMETPLTARCLAEDDGRTPGVGSAAVGTSTNWLTRWWPLLLLGVLALVGLGALGFFLRRQAHSETDRGPGLEQWDATTPEDEVPYDGGSSSFMA